MMIEAMGGVGGAGAAVRSMLGAGGASGPGALGGFGRPDPNQPLADRGVGIGELSNVADALGTTTEELAAELGADATFADLVGQAREAEVDPRDFLQAVATDLGVSGPGAAGGFSMPGAASGVAALPPLVFDHAGGTQHLDLLADWLGSGTDDA